MAELLHMDKLGRAINLGDVVVAPQSNSLIIAKVIKINPKMIKIKKLNSPNTGYYNGEYNKYPTDLVIVNGPDVTAYLLKL
jgi:hypothetical protein